MAVWQVQANRRKRRSQAMGARSVRPATLPPMNDRPDWLPEPIEPPRRPLSERLHLAAISVASLLLGIFGLLLVASSGFAVWTLLTVQRGPSSRVIFGPAGLGLAALVVAYLLRWCLQRERQRGPK